MAGERRDIEELHPVVRSAAKAILKQLRSENLPFEIFEAFRTPQRQRTLFNQGGVTKADAWRSYHQYGVAIDLVWKDSAGWSWNTAGKRLAQWKRMNEIGRVHGLEPLSWELPHLQLAGLSLADLRAGRYPAGGDESWAAALISAIESWPQGAPPMPVIGGERPSLPDADPIASPSEAIPPGPLAEGVERATFERAQAVVKGYEGGFSDHAADAGGPTNWGITHRTLARWRRVAAVSAAEVKALSYEEAKDIYFAFYWSKMHCGVMPGPLALALYNIGIHCGTGIGAEYLQRAANAQGAGLEVDSDIGPKTVAAVARCDLGRLITQVLDLYEQRLQAHPRFDVFGAGFMNRVAHLREETGRWLSEWLQAPRPADPPHTPTTEQSDMSTPAPADQIVPLLIRLAEALRARGTPPVPTIPVQPVPAPPASAVDPLIGAILKALLEAQTAAQPPATPVTPAPEAPPAPLGPVNGALGTTIGNLLNGRKAGLGIIGSMVLGILNISKDGSFPDKLAGVVTSAAPVLGGMSGPLLPVFLALTAWGVLGKQEKYLGPAPPAK